MLKNHLLTVLGLLPVGLLAQSPVDIGIYNNRDGQVEVRLRPQENFNGILSSVVFTLRWDKSSGATLGDISQEQDMVGAINMNASGTVRENGNYNYQVFAGFGFSPMSDAGLALEAGKEITLAVVPVNGKAEIELVNDAWTGELANNGDYYVSLGGQDRTGLIYKDLASAADTDGTVTIRPNPNDGLFSFQFTVLEPTDLQVEIVNALGQVVFAERQAKFVGAYRKEMDLTAQSNGVYYLKVTRNGEQSVHKVVYR